MDEIALKRLRETMTLEASQAMTTLINRLGQKWATYPEVTGQDKIASLLRGFTKAEMGLALVHKSALAHKPEDWMRAPELAVDCAQVVCDQLKAELEIVDDRYEYVVTVTKKPKLEIP